jgi:hypothetical protein
LSTSTETLGLGAIGRLLPLIIGLFAVVDVAARWLPIDPLCFQAWACVTRYQEPGAIFEANRQFRSARTHGNLSNMGNLPSQRVYRPQVFTTDARGFRNPASAETAPVSALVVGDSFAAGDGISDDETLTAQLSAATGRRFYNAAGPYAYLGTVKSLKSKLGFQQGPVIIAWTESEPIDQLQQAEAQVEHPVRSARLLKSVFGPDTRAREWLRGWWFTSPLKIIWEKAFVSLSNDRVLPNIYARLVVQRRLQNGDTALFYPSDVEPFHQHRDVGPARAYIARLAAALKHEGMQPLVVLIPHKYSVYYPLVDGPKAEPGDAVHPMAALEAALRSDGIAALDLTETFRARAREELAEGRYIYWRDDTHWNGRGVAVAAAAIRQAWFTDRARVVASR